MVLKHKGFNTKVFIFFRFSESIGEKPFDFSVTQSGGQRARVWAQVFDLHNGSYIARFKLFESYQQLKITILHNGQNVADSPYLLNGKLISLPWQQ